MERTQVLLQTESLKRQKRNQQFLGSTVYHTFVIALGLLMLYPVMWLFASSVKPADEIWTNVNSLIPSQIYLQNYTNGWKGFGGYSFAVFYKNSFLYAGLGTIFVVTASTIVAYGFSRLKFRGKTFWFTIMMMTLMLPTQVLIIPQYIVFSQLGWLNTFLPLLLPRLGGDVGVILGLKQLNSWD
jgi:multiple sugar transport system permease protein